MRLDRAAAARGDRATRVARAARPRRSRAPPGASTRSINEDVARAFRVHAAERGFDYRALQHGRLRRLAARSTPLRIARKLRIPRVVFPLAGRRDVGDRAAGPPARRSSRATRTACALDELDAPRRSPQILRSALVDEASRSCSTRGDRRRRRSRSCAASTCATTARATRSRSRCPRPRIRAGARRAARAVRGALRASFSPVTSNDQPIEIVNWKVAVTGPRPARQRGRVRARSTSARPAPRSRARGRRTSRKRRTRRLPGLRPLRAGARRAAHRARR